MNIAQDVKEAASAPQDDWGRLVTAIEFAQARAPWLATAGMMVPRADAAVLVDRIGDGDHRLTAAWPVTEPGQADLEKLAREAIEERRGLVSFAEDEEPGLEAGAGHSHLAYPIILGDTVPGAAAFSISSRDPVDINAAMRSIQWSLAWIRDVLQQSGTTGTGPTIEVLEILADLLGPTDFQAASHAFVIRLCSRFGLERASLGFRKRKSTVVSTISNSASFGRRMNLVRLTEQAMDEAIDQERAILFPARDKDSGVIRRCHERLSQEQDGTGILTLPLVDDGEILGALLLESASDRLPSQHDIDMMGAIAAFAGPLLVLRREESRNLLNKNLRALAALPWLVLGRRYGRTKLVVLALAASALALALVPADYQINADASIEAKTRRAIVAPYDGFIMEAPRRAGDTVRAGDLVVALDDRDMALEALNWESERQARALEYGRALSERNLRELNVFKARVQQAEVRLKQVNARIERAKLQAPIDGVVASGDLSQSIGGPFSAARSCWRSPPWMPSGSRSRSTRARSMRSGRE
ncbi:GAF domain-containing protein [Roseibium salinum]|uniref:GAF domain-containing protein n=1 Tax=Roseibium salinum TaxID=1604349 RepID=A0ABT3QVM0_9HYPH|nr:GAF domain-containing protein [Roseibium sp. DSM 29163]MCX2720920.1 GAF domain-containing protein [Roseibium sp. DSM 29163]